MSVYCLACMRGRGKGGQTTLLPNPLTMPTFQILTSPPITKRGATCLVPDVKMCRGKHPPKLPYGSLTYNCQKGDMLEWLNEDGFQEWLTTEEQQKMIKLIVCCTAESDSPNWWAHHVFRCSCELSGGRTNCKNKRDWDQKIPSKKTSCKCQLIIKQYPNMETMLSKYEGEHDHPLGNDNL
jgi:hypothetical protein